jgi:ribosomal protein L40E
MNAKQKSENEKFCSECGELINIKAEICPKCGVRQAAVKAGSEKSRMVTAFLALFLGGVGAHFMWVGWEQGFYI